MNKSLVIVYSCLALAAAGCYSQKGEIARYRAVLDAPINGPTTRPMYDPNAPLSLVGALQVANDDNESIARSGEDYIQALTAKMRAAGAFLPTLSLAPSYTLTRTRGNSGGSIVIPGSDGTTTPVIIGGNDGGTQTSTSVPLNASLNGSFSDVSALGAAGRTVEQQKQLLLNQRETILLQVVAAYYDVLRFERQIGVFENSIRLREEQLRNQEARLRLGAARPLDVAQSQADLAETRVQLAQARTDAANARSALARLMGVSVVTGQLVDAYDVPAAPGEMSDWLTTAVRDRQDLLAAARAQESARLNVDSAIRQYIPSASINFNYFLYNDPKSTQTWTGGVNLNVPIFSALQIEADVRQAWSIYRQSALAERETRRVVIDDVTQNFQNFLNSRYKLQDLQIQLEAAQRALSLSERAYQLGSETNLDRLLQQDAVLTAQLNLVTEQFAEKSNYLGLLRASGKLASVLQ